ncbi:MAG: hypothetical protein AB7K41_11145 [Bdellovibrionales bacterium]
MQASFKIISRRQFFKSAALGTGSLLVLSFLPKVQAAQPGQTLNSTISRNHGHRFSATLEEVLSAGPKDYDIQGSSRHPHTLTLTQEILDTLKEVKAVEVESTNDAGHSHIVRLEIV